MFHSMTPRQKALWAVFLLAGVALLAASSQIGFTWLARWLLAGSLVGALLILLKKRAWGTSEDMAKRRLTVVERAPIAQGCAAVLLEADGRTYLVVHGQGFAQIQELAAPSAPFPAPKRVTEAATFSLRELL